MPSHSARWLWSEYYWSIPHLQVYRTDIPTREPSTLLIARLCHDLFLGILRVSSIALLSPVSALDGPEGYAFVQARITGADIEY